MDGLELRVLGSLEVRRDGVAVAVPAARQRDLLVGLALQANRLVPTDRLVALLWDGEPPATARNTLHTLVRRLRRVLPTGGGDSPLETRPGGYLLRIDPDRLDAHRFETLLQRGRRLLAAGDAAAAAAALDRALELWRGVALADVSATDLVRVERPRLAELRRQAEEERVEARLRCGEHAALVAELRAAVAADPLRERPYGQLMLALYRCGRQGEALAVYRELRQALTEQLGVEPGPDLQWLHQAMLRADPSLQTPAAAADPPEDSPPVPAQLPAEPAGFTGRADALATLRRLRDGTGERAAAVVAVVGTAGVGKTALVLRWAHRLRPRFPDGQLYVDLHGFSATSPVRPVEALGSFLRALGVPADQVPSQEQEAAACYRTLLADRRVLVVLDNARDAAQVRPLLPAGRACLAVVTSRDRLDPLVVTEGAARLPLAPMARADSHALLARALGRQRLADEPAAADALADLCADLPLAMRIAAANLAGRGAIAGYLDQLRDARLDRLSLPGGGPVAIRATFDASYTRLDEPARRMFRLLGCAPGPDVTAAAAAALAATGRREAARLLEELAAAHLLTELAPGRFGCHDLLRHYAGQLAGGMPEAERSAAVVALAEWYAAATESAADLVNPARLRLPSAGRPPADPSGELPGWQRPAQALDWLDAERHNLVAVARQSAAAAPPVAWRLAAALRTCLPQRGHLAELQAICEAGQAAAEAAGDPATRAAARLALGTAQWARRHPEAVASYRAAVALAEGAGWHEGAAAALSNLATALQHTGQQAEAATCYARALAAYDRLGRPDGQAAVLLNLGNTCWEAGELDQAGDHFRRALERFRATGARAAQAVALSNLGDVLLRQQRPDAALTHLTEALSLNQELGNRASEAATMRTLAEVHRDLGRLAPARELATAALEAARQTGHRMLEAAVLDALASIHERDGEPDRALHCAREAMAATPQAGSAHLRAQIHLRLSGVYRALGCEELATSHASQALTSARANGHQALVEQAVAALGQVSKVAGAGP